MELGSFNNLAQHGKCNIFFKSLHPTIHAAGGGKGAGLLTLHAAVLDAGGAGVGPCDLAASPRLNVRGRAGPDDR